MDTGATGTQAPTLSEYLPSNGTMKLPDIEGVTIIGGESGLNNIITHDCECDTSNIRIMRST